ncbi:MAG: FAD binding domain-containing protein [Tenuifilaceae bacterium]|jgi:xanthine dehydrogenase YagS FAD-binding subunit|nr:FAD binding domain-containing protein [Limnochordia bacterium]MDX9771680.1 FAD binding domain-containing protein [Tenuifilaceae bacterium]
MREFKLVNTTTVDAAVSSLSQYNGTAVIMAGGTDLLGSLKREILPSSPEAVVNIQNIPDMDYIKEEGGMLKIGALARLDDIAGNTIIKTKYAALAQAAAKTASPHLRVMGTIGGNICQQNRCWYFRASNNYFDCLRKGGNLCYAMAGGDNRYHSIFGAMGGCLAVNPSDTAPALVTLDASIVTTKRTIAAEEFWAAPMMDPTSTVLDKDEIVTEIQIPAFSGKSAFVKFATRTSIDFPIVNCAAAIDGSNARICLNAVSGIPYRATSAEDAIKGKTIDEANAEAAGAAAVSKAIAMTANGSNPGNKYKVQIAKTMVKRAILACA